MTLNSEIRLSYPLDLEGCRAIVVGGGTSLRGFDFTLLENDFTVGANLAAIKAGCQALVSIDRNFIKNYSQEIDEYARDHLVLLGYAEDWDFNRQPCVSGAIQCRNIRGSHAYVPEFHLTGTNSGYAALQFAFQSGASEIYMLGFDMKSGRDGKHFFGQYRHGTSPGDVMRNWSRGFEVLASAAREKGVRIINYVGEPGSLLDCFEVAPLRNLGCFLQ